MTVDFLWNVAVSLNPAAELDISVVKVVVKVVVEYLGGSGT